MDTREFLKSIAGEVTAGDLVFPTSAQVALRVSQALEDPDCHVDQAARLLQAEPVLAARVVAMANAAAYNRSGREITDVKAAISRLGFGVVRALAMALVTRQIAANGMNGACHDLANRLWEHTAHVAALAQVLARRVTHQNAETALFAGIVHEIGGFYLLFRAKDQPAMLDGDAPDWSGGYRVDLERAVLATLNVPAAVAAAVEEHWQGYLAFPPRSLGDTLLLADELAPVPSPLAGGPLVGREGLAGSIELVVGAETLQEILWESADDVTSLTTALRF